LEVAVSLVVTGIAQNEDTKPVETALRAAGLSLEGLVVFCAGEAREERAETGVRYIYSGSESIRNILGTGSIGILSLGPEVPGISTESAPPEYFRDETMTDELSDLDIPDSELDNYVEAIEAGRCLVAYYAERSTVDTAAGAFRQSGIANVRVF
jgi:hypothetical protein